MRKIFTKTRLSLLAIISILFIASSCTQKMELESPNHELTSTCFINNKGEAVYSVFRNGEEILFNSKLGLILSDSDFSKDLKIARISPIKVITDQYQLLHGKKLDNSYTANEQTVTLTNADGKSVDVIFRVSNDGIAFRYHFEETSTEIKKITSEESSFRFTPTAKAWMQPMSKAKTGWCETNPSYEEHYMQEIPVGTLSPIGSGWVFPALFKTNETWVLISETALDRNYCGCRLYASSPDGEYRIGFPEASEGWQGEAVNPESTLPWYTPWRVITIGDLGTIVESTLETDLAAPAIEGDFSWVKPGKASWSWVLLKDDNTVYDVQKKFIDYASAMNWPYCLVDADWDRKIGYDKIAELAEYAATKNVSLILWYNSSGPWNSTQYSPKSQLLTHEQRVAEFDKISKMGIKGVKVDFFGGDGQSMIAYYLDILKDAADAHIMVNFHGCTYPRSWHRTYPNLVSMEAIKGMEFITFEQANADAEPNHASMLNYTRNACSPMDFTPMVLNTIPRIDRKTTNAFELATAVLFQSGIQHYAETPDGMKIVPEDVQEILRHIPSGYDETKFVDGYPGKYTIIARRAGNMWYLAGINGENKEKPLHLDLSFMNKHEGYLVSEGEDNFSFNRDSIQLNGDKSLDIKLKPNGGFLIKFN